MAHQSAHVQIQFQQHRNWSMLGLRGASNRSRTLARSSLQKLVRAFLWRGVKAGRAGQPSATLEYFAGKVRQSISWTCSMEFARALFPLGEVHELNCAGLEHICLEGFDCLKHRCILWDEGAASLVSRNRKVFQHPLCQVDIGHSPTGQHVRRYFLGNSCSIVATNKWHQDVAQLPVGDQEWLASNTVVLEIDQPMWEDPDQLTRCMQKFQTLRL